jgi:hypothetical protein
MAHAVVGDTLRAGAAVDVGAGGKEAGGATSVRTEKLSMGVIEDEDAGRTSAETRAQFGTLGGGGAGVAAGGRGRLTVFGLFGRDALPLRASAAVRASVASALRTAPASASRGNALVTGCGRSVGGCAVAASVEKLAC